MDDWKRTDVPSWAGRPFVFGSMEAGKRTSGRDIVTENRPPLWQERAAYLALIFFLALIYITPGSLSPLLEDVPISKGVAVLSFFFLLWAKGSRGEKWRFFDKTSFWLIVFVAIEGFSILTALWKVYALTVFLNALKLVWIYFLIINLVDSVRRVRSAFWTLVLAAMAPAAGALIRYLSKTDLVEGYRAAWVGVFADPNDLAYHLIVLIPILLALLETESSPRLKGVLLIALAVFIAAIYVTFSRGGLIGLTVILFFRAWRSKNRMMNISAGALILIALLGWAPSGYRERAETILKFRQDESAMGRIYAWRAGVSMALDRPVLGVGVGCFVLGWPIYAPPEAGTKWRAAHNTFVEVLGENGILGFIAFFAFIATALRGAQKVRPERFDPIPLLLRKSWNRSPLSYGEAGKRGTKKGLDQMERLERYARGLEIALWGFLACGVTLGVSRSWAPYLFVALIVSLRRIWMERTFGKPDLILKGGT